MRMKGHQGISDGECVVSRMLGEVVRQRGRLRHMGKE